MLRSFALFMDTGDGRLCFCVPRSVSVSVRFYPFTAPAMKLSWIFLLMKMLANISFPAKSGRFLVGICHFLLMIFRYGSSMPSVILPPSFPFSFLFCIIEPTRYIAAIFPLCFWGKSL